MKRFIRLFAAVAAIAALPAVAVAAPVIGKAAPDFTAIDAEGKTVKLSDFKGKTVVMEWNNPGCPFVQKHYESGNMQKLQSYATEQGAAWLVVNSSAKGKQGHMDSAAAQEHVKETGSTVTHYLLDPEGRVGKLYEAKVTPHMYVINDKGTLVYMGAIDDKPTPDQASIQDAKNYVLEALDELRGGKPITTASTQAYGCSIKYAE